AHGGASPAQVGGEPSLRCDADVDLGPLPRPAPVLLHQDPHVKGGAPYGGEAKVGLHDVALSPLDAGDALVERFEPAGLVLPSSPPPLVPSTEPPPPDDPLPLAPFGGLEKRRAVLFQEGLEALGPRELPGVRQVAGEGLVAGHLLVQRPLVEKALVEILHRGERAEKLLGPLGAGTAFPAPRLDAVVDDVRH